MIHSIYPGQMKGLVAEQEVKLLDVRTPEEFVEVHASGAINIQLDELSLEKVKAELPYQAGEKVYVICRSGKRSMVACQILNHQGATCELVNVEGGTIEWVDEGLPVSSGPK